MSGSSNDSFILAEHVSLEDLDAASLALAQQPSVEDDCDSTTGVEGHHLVPTGVIGAEFREAEAQKERVVADCPATAQASRTSKRFTGIAKLNIRGTEQTLNVMCVGEAGMGKSTLVESFFKTFKVTQDDEVNRGEESRRVQEKKQMLTRQENLLREAEKEMARLKDEDKLLEAEEQRKKIASIQEEWGQIKGEVEQLRAEDDTNRLQIEVLKKEIQLLKHSKEDAKRADNLTEAHELKGQLAQKEREKKELANRLQRTTEASELPGGTPATGGGSGPGGLILGPTVEVTAKPAFTIMQQVHNQPPTNLKVTLIDTPGYGDNTNLETTFKKIVHFVDEQFRAQRKEEEKPKRGAEQIRGLDPLVHCVLYFIAPHRLKPVDIAFMKELHKKVNIIPIIAKSDTMTSDEKKDFKAKVREELERHSIDVFEFHRPTMDAMSNQAEVTIEYPWAVIATKDAKIEDGEIIAKRAYDWGDADAANPQHSDLLALQTLILGEAEAWKDLKKQSDGKYELWREETIANEQREAAQPFHVVLRSRALTCYSRIPPIYMISLVVLLLTMIIAPMALKVSAGMLRSHADSATSELSSKLQLQEGELFVNKGWLQEVRDEATELHELLRLSTQERDLLKAGRDRSHEELVELKRDKVTLQQAVDDKKQLLEKERQSTWQCELDLKNVRDQPFDRDVVALKRQIRDWHASSKAWYLEQLPREFID